MFTVLDDDDDLDIPASTPSVTVSVEDTIPVVTEIVTVRPLTGVEQERSYLEIPPSHWDADQLLSYVADQIQHVHGVFPRDPKKEKVIMNSFLSRWKEKAGPIAVYAFEQEHGMWMNAPVGLSRFMVSSDQLFGSVIVKKFS